MKKLRSCFILLALAALCLAAPRGSSAVDLEAGWYAQIWGVSVYALDVNNNPYLYGGGWFYSDLGTYGPFTVTAEPTGYPQDTRTVRVLNNAYGVAPGTSVELPIGAMPERIAYISLGWHTNYDSTKMRLEFVHRDPSSDELTMLWAQNLSGNIGGDEIIAFEPPNNGLMFRVAALPEPTSLAVLATSISMLGLAAMRRKLNK